MSTAIYSGPMDLAERTERDGCFVAKNFLDRDAVLEARAEVKAILDADEARREAEGDIPAVDSTTPFRSIFVPLMHTAWFMSCQSPAFCRLVNDMFAHPEIQRWIRHVCGDNLRLRVDLARRASGANDYVDDFQIPHVWHRDTLGEFTFGIFLDDMPEDRGDVGGTAVIKGTHWDGQDPRWDLMLGQNNVTRKEHLQNKSLLNLPPEHNRGAMLNRMVRERARKKKFELTGQMGDIYLFLNDCWHGRAPNTTGERFMLARIGGFASDFPFKDDIPLPDSISALPEPLRGHYNRSPRPNSDPNTLLRRMSRSRKPSLLTWLAAREKDRIVKQAIGSAEKQAETESA
ncbi:MAG: phytanoyl-CoA dioxygenase family protein [Pseudomonadota bacterium]